LVFKQAPETDLNIIPKISATGVFAGLTGLFQDDVRAIGRIARSDNRKPPIFTVIPDEVGGLGAVVLSLYDSSDSPTVFERWSDDERNNVAVAVWSSTLKDVSSTFGNEITAIKKFFQEVDTARERSPLNNILPRVRIILYHNPNRADQKNFRVMSGAIQKAATDPREPLYGVQLIPWNADDPAVAEEVKAVLREGLEVPVIEPPT
jgi:hypothetical protein